MPGAANAANKNIVQIQNPVVYFEAKVGRGYECYWLQNKEGGKQMFIGRYMGTANDIDVVSQDDWDIYFRRLQSSDPILMVSGSGVKLNTLVFEVKNGKRRFVKLSELDTYSTEHRMNIFVSNCGNAPPPPPNEPGLFSFFKGGKKTRKHKKRAKKSSKRKTRR